MRREIETALESKRNIVPLMLAGFSFGTPADQGRLTGELAALTRYNGLPIPEGYFPEAMDRLRNRFLAVPVDAVLHPASDAAQQVAKEQGNKARVALGNERKLSAIQSGPEERPTDPTGFPAVQPGQDGQGSRPKSTSIPKELIAKSSGLSWIRRQAGTASWMTTFATGHLLAWVVLLVTLALNLEPGRYLSTFMFIHPEWLVVAWVLPLLICWLWPGLHARSWKLGLVALTVHGGMLTLMYSRLGNYNRDYTLFDFLTYSPAVRSAILYGAAVFTGLAWRRVFSSPANVKSN
jgi:hypothetical protein